MASLAGKPNALSQAGELEYWKTSGIFLPNVHVTHYLKLFPFDSIDYSAPILDIGSGPVSVFESLAPPHADIVPADTLAEEYNRLVTDKRFAVVARIPDRQFPLITLFNMLDHMDDPAALLRQVARHASGEVWIYVHLDRPFDPHEHPQKFRAWSIARFIGSQLCIERCGLHAETPWLHGFWAVCRTGRDSRFRSGCLSASLTAQYLGLYLARAKRKLLRMCHRQD